MVCAEEFQQVTPVVCTWEAFDYDVKCELTSTALLVAGQWVFVDPIELRDDALEELRSLGEPGIVVCTSANHARAAAWYRRRFGCRVVAHRAAAAGLETDADILVEDGADLSVALPIGGNEVEVIAVPGAAEGEIALFLPAAGVLCLGDALINLPATGFAFLPDKYCTDAKLLRSSLRKLLRCEFGVLTFAHGLPVTAQAQRRLSALLA